MRAAHFTPTFLYLTGGLIVWGVRFLAVYIFTALACARGWSAASLGGIGIIPLGVSVLTLPAILACGAFLLWAIRQLRQPDPPGEDAAENTRFVHYVAATIAALALLAVVWETLPVFLVPVCATA